MRGNLVIHRIVIDGEVDARGNPKSMLLSFMRRHRAVHDSLPTTVVVDGTRSRLKNGKASQAVLLDRR